MRPQPLVKNSAGDVILLNSKEQYIANQMQKTCNALGYEVSITTLTQIVKKVSEERFFELPPADYVPMVIGNGTWDSNLVTFRSFNIADEFETGMVNLSGQSNRLAAVDAGIDAVTVLIYNWAKTYSYSVFELQQASKSGNWDLIAEKEKSRKKSWDLGIQRIAFLGARGQNGASGNCVGILNQSGVTFNTTLLSASISSLSTSSLKTFCANVVGAYRTNVNFTRWPNRLIVPESDWTGLASQASPDFPIKSTLQLLEETFQITTMQKDFKILPCAYADTANSGSTLTKQTYALYNYDETSMRMDIPLQYYTTLANTIDNFSFQNAGLGQFTGLQLYRPLELLYFGY